MGRFAAQYHTGRSWFVIVAIIGMLVVSPLLVTAQDGTPETDGVVEEVVAPTPTPTPVPPTPTPTPEPTPTPTPVPPTPTPTPVPPTPTPTPVPHTPTPEPTPTPVPLPNTDALTATTAADSVSIAPGEEHEYAFSYAVTTPRTSTTIAADLRFADGSAASGWIVRAQAGQGAVTGSGAMVEVVESGTLAQDTAFPLTFIVQAPADVTAEHSVSLYISSMAMTERGEVETGIEQPTTAVATLSVIPPTPTPEATATEAAERQPTSAPETGEDQKTTEPPAGNELDAGQDATPAATATATDESDEMVVSNMVGILDAAVTEKSDALTCDPESHAAVTAGESVTFTCSATGYENIKVRVSSESQGWSYAFSLAPDSTDNPRESDVRATEGFTDFTITLTPGEGEDVIPEGSVLVEVIRVDASGHGEAALASVTLASAVLEAERATTPTQAPSEGDFGLGCDPLEPASGGVGEALAFNCTFTSLETLGARDPAEITLESLALQVPAGWTLTHDGAQVTDGGWSIEPDAVITTDPSSSYTFSFTLTPDSCEAASEDVTLTSMFSDEGSDDGQDGPTAIVHLVFARDTTQIAIGAISDNFSTTRQFSLEDQTVSGSISYLITERGCSSWEIQLDATEFEYSGPVESASALPGTLSSHSVTSDAVTLENNAVPLGSGPVTVVEAVEADQDGTMTHTLDLEMTLPGGAPAGSYTSTLTITAASGP